MKCDQCNRKWNHTHSQRRDHEYRGSHFVPKRILIACEFSGVVREAFAQKGHDVWSCDVRPTEIPGNHYQCDVREILEDGWDMLIAFPPCTHLAASGARYWKQKQADGRQQEAVDFVLALWNSSIPHKCIENPVGLLNTSSQFFSPSQIIQPFHHGHSVKKSTCLWLSGLPLLKPSNIVDEGEFYTGKNGKRYHKFMYSMSTAKDRSKMRSITFSGIAKAMADQWGKHSVFNHNYPFY